MGAEGPEHCRMDTDDTDEEKAICEIRVIRG